MSQATAQKYHLAVYNRGSLKNPMGDDSNKEFIASLGPVMKIAETSQGFVWRFRSGVDGPNDPVYQEIDRQFPGTALLNLSLWESVADLKHFVYKSAMGAYYRRRKEWFHDHTGDLPPVARGCPAPHHVLWWVPAGSKPPTFADAAEKCEHLLKYGETAEAFTMQRPFPQPGASEEEERSQGKNDGVATKAGQIRGRVHPAVTISVLLAGIAAVAAAKRSGRI